MALLFPENLLADIAWSFFITDLTTISTDVKERNDFQSRRTFNVECQQTDQIVLYIVPFAMNVERLLGKFLPPTTALRIHKVHLSCGFV